MDTTHLFISRINQRHLKKQLQTILIFGIFFFILFSIYVPVTAVYQSNTQWNLTITATSENGNIDTVIIGEASTATDGSPHDGFDVPKTIPPLTPYIRCWLDDNINEPYDELWEDYREYPDVQKTWDLTVQWVPTDYTSPTDITLTWDKTLLLQSEYTTIDLCDESGNILRNMKNTNLYTFNAQAMIPHSFTIKASRALSYSLSINKIGNGTGIVEIYPLGPYDSGETVTLWAKPSTSSIFTEWTGDLSGSTTPQTLVMNSNKIVNAKFTLKCYTLEIMEIGNGTTTKNPLKECYTHGTSVQIEAIPDPGLSFASWSGDFISDENPATLLVQKDMVITATFGHIIYNLNISVVGEGLVIPSEGTHRYAAGTTIDIEALPSSGWKFNGWSQNLTGSNNPTTITINANASITATFVKKSSSGSGGGSGGSSSPVDLISPVAIADGPYEGVIQEVIILDASKSYDLDGSITSYRWGFGDDTTGEGKTISHEYSAVGNYSIILQVTDNDGQVTTYRTYAIITSSIDHPPSIYSIYGPIYGSVNITYSYNITIQDLDDDVVTSSIDWNDGTVDENLILSTHEPTLITHEWVQFGIYTITITASDNATTVSENLMVYIDTFVLPYNHILNVSGYLIDSNSDNTYDAFYNSKLNTSNEIKQANGSVYLLDTDLDGIWDIQYDLENNQYLDYEQKNTDSEERPLLMLIFTIITIIIILSVLIGYKIYSNKKMIQKKISSKKRVTQKR